MAVPETMKALVQLDDVNKVGIREIPLPPLEKGELLVKVDYVALNPTDWKHIDTRSPPGAILGCDYTGRVAASADSGARDHIKVGTRVAGWVHGNLFPDRGAFAQYLKVPADLTFVVPDKVKPEEAAAFGIPYFTSFQGLHHSQKSGWPPVKESGKWALIYGGSTSVGFFAIQLAKMLGFKVATACSPRNFDLVKSYGADAAFDYRNADECVAGIRKVSGGGVDTAMDCISEGASQAIAMKCFKDKPSGQLNIILTPDAEAQKIRPDVAISSTLVYTTFGKAFNFGTREGPEMTLPAMPHEREWFAEVIKRTPEYIEAFGMRAPPISVREGLENIPKGFQELRDGKVSAQRLVYKI